MDEKKIKRINELYKKQKAFGLTKEEKVEQEQLRSEYIETVKRNFRATMGNVQIQNDDGTIKHLKSK